MSQLIMNAILAEAAAKEAKAIANLQNYMANSVGVGEHPDVVSECTKLIEQISEARGIRDTIKVISDSSNNQNKEE